MSRLTANTRTVVKHNYALITPDSYVGSVMPGWKNVDIRVVINPAMGANISQHLITIKPDSLVNDRTELSQIFFYVIDGSCKITVGGRTEMLAKGGYVYIPVDEEYQIEGPGARLVSFQKLYEPLEDYDIPEVVFGDSNKLEKALYLGDPQLEMQYLLPDHIAMDFAVNIFTYHPGGNLPFVEIHIMEHGLLYL